MHEARFELWQRKSGDSLYNWMVWDRAAMRPEWFQTEGDALTFIARMKADGHV
jgi:hypothetical protein